MHAILPVCSECNVLYDPFLSVIKP